MYEFGLYDRIEEIVTDPEWIRIKDEHENSLKGLGSTPGMIPLRKQKTGYYTEVRDVWSQVQAEAFEALQDEDEALSMAILENQEAMDAGARNEFGGLLRTTSNQ